MNKLIVDLNKLFINNNKAHIIHAYDLLKKFNSDEWKQYACLPENGCVKRSLTYNMYDSHFDLCLFSWSSGSICREKHDNMSVYKVLEGSIYHFENSYEGNVGVKNSTKFVDYNNFDSFQTINPAYSLHLYLK